MSKEKIVRIIEVVDTREYEQVGERWVAIRGSGESHTCDRCGRQHEVLASVELDSGKRAVVGTGCMTKDEVAPSTKMRLERRAKRVKSLNTQLDHWYKLDEEYKEIKKKVSKMKLPEYTVSNADLDYSNDKVRRDKYTMGDISAYNMKPDKNGEKYYTLYLLEGRWRAARENELGITYDHRHTLPRILEIERALKKLE